jgi:hypothetical protein
LSLFDFVTTLKAQNLEHPTKEAHLLQVLNTGATARAVKNKATVSRKFLAQRALLLAYRSVLSLFASAFWCAGVRNKMQFVGDDGVAHSVSLACNGVKAAKPNNHTFGCN